MSGATLPVVIGTGIVDGLNPCAFGVLLSFVAVTLGTMALTADPRPRLWRAGGIYVTGMFVTYFLLGLGVIASISLITATHLPIRLMGFAVVIMGLWTLKDVAAPGVGAALAMPVSWHATVRRALSRTTPAGLFAAGALVGLCALPCSGAIYMGVLALIAREPIALRLPYLLVYNLMFVAPLLVLLGIVANRRVFNRIAHAFLKRRVMAKAVVGVVTVLLGLVILATA